MVRTFPVSDSAMWSNRYDPLPDVEPTPRFIQLKLIYVLK